MIKIIFHIHDRGEDNWRHESLEFATLPSVGEYVTTGLRSPWYRVELVVHTPFPCESDAEVYAVKVDYNEIQKNLS
ncbi:hypothetical protein DFP93_10128 [Aneurinibacillus soli]|uniref:Uncharacterized protein n=1 Tax=Aneurinibacillus soli TaxID=1500254 RepID=A0A0U5AW35_9BACL|nr:hypothetical protein [Aneurinibacillus soli]PYE64004.1 hypothetical protein DFP93_10128 [Aneurinibacillus soli]BAU27953.1 hypothetical protein CB4_02127 [Aneurinibacillus soli]